ncbi:NADPH-dependent 2,4-dienoyl-CoA reductase/sulfur reductase-like enzyme [Amycolatopsis lexingtonensis]|uniref:NADPH-dependent 2,4-dienoyl-CoA reductase/sulfur reductase-like enzyme n=1 Tax=Amycolatopsis lexingtonensis TaxID=218822 RepID=A0ABR9HR28_9PSEU|nr:NAD(P)/FAD-dependent oxidoreductase [Amycolatopsis lexingtonensis]MBE1493365.1 NADPH-dependent 2,4-dienoyl-CoA reductase/sulfur reductase-like enzyme [Amycolatopsis lexingtonensis]
MTRVVVVGAGPAGLAAAEHAVRAGADVTLLDQSDAPGGQYHRKPPGAPHGFEALLSRCSWWPESTVWAVDGKRLHVLRGPADGAGRQRHVLEPDALVLATGAHDRTLPFPGWQLPGVFTAGAAQALAKGDRVAVGNRVLVAGAGPFLLPVAESLLAVGADVLAVLEANPASTVRKGWSWRDARKAGELARYAVALARHRVPYHLGRTVVEARGDDRVREVVTARLRADWSVVPGTERTYEVDAVCIGHGFAPQPELAVAAGCALDGGFVRVGADQGTSVPGVFAAGELTGIGGADAAAAEGAVAGCTAAGGVPDRALLRERDRTRAFAARLAAAHPIGAAWPGWLREDTIVCRCEETTAGELTRAARDPAAPGPHALKLGTRAGLGPCQGRMCGAAVSALCGTAERHHRPIAQPIRLGELADVKENDV